MVLLFSISEQCYKFSIYRNKKTSLLRFYRACVCVSIGTLKREVAEREVKQEEEEEERDFNKY